MHNPDQNREKYAHLIKTAKPPSISQARIFVGIFKSCIRRIMFLSPARPYPSDQIGFDFSFAEIIAYVWD